MYFPWPGLLEQVRLADVFVHYDDVQLTRGFFNRVQIKTEGGTRWMTVPLRDVHRGQTIDETLIDYDENWQVRHLGMLRQAYSNAPFKNDMIQLVENVISQRFASLADLARGSMSALIDYFGIGRDCQFIFSRKLGIGGSGSDRILNIVKSVDGATYITGHGARNYLNHDHFEQSGISVEYMQYRCLPYPQLHGAFTPYVSALDLIANCGRAGAGMIQSGTVGWREFMESRNE